MSEIPKHDRITLSQARRNGRGHSWPCPPNECLCPPSEDCAPKKLTGSRLLECKSRPNIPKSVFTALEFVSKNCVFVNLRRISFKFWDEDLFFWSSLQISSKIAKILRRQPEFVEILGRRPFFSFFGLHLFRLIHTRINFSCPQKFLSVPPHPQSRYPGAGPALSNTFGKYFRQIVAQIWSKDCFTYFRYT